MDRDTLKRIERIKREVHLAQGIIMAIRKQDILWILERYETVDRQINDLYQLFRQTRDELQPLASAVEGGTQGRLPVVVRNLVQAWIERRTTLLEAIARMTERNNQLVSAGAILFNERASALEDLRIRTEQWNIAQEMANDLAARNLVLDTIQAKARLLIEKCDACSDLPLEIVPLIEDVRASLEVLTL
jgi:hypothetical protein